MILSSFLQTGDRSGELTARMNVSDLQTVLGLSYCTSNSTLSDSRDTEHAANGTQADAAAPPSLSLPTRRMRSDGALDGGLTELVVCCCAVCRSEAAHGTETQHGEPGADEAHAGDQAERKAHNTHLART